MRRINSGSMRSAFTLVELLVVIAIIAMMVLMMLPAVNSARESARRSQCLTRMSQISVAMHNHEMAFETFPAGVTNPDGPILNRPEGLHRSWVIDLLPHLDEANLHSRVVRDASVYSEEHSEILRRSVPALQCPSSSARNDGESCYAAVHHDVESPIDADNHGVFYLNSNTTRDDISDGLRYTYFLGEKRSVSGGDLGWMSGTRSTLRNTGTPIGVTVATRRNERFNYRSVNATGESSDLAETVEGSTGQPPAASGRDDTYVGGFGSEHPGGALFVFGDGSVRFVPESISMAVYQRHGHRADGELIDSIE